MTMERYSLCRREEGKLPALTRRAEPENLEAQILALRQLQSLPGFIAGMRVAEKDKRGSGLKRLLAGPGSAVARAFRAIGERWSETMRSLFAKKHSLGESGGAASARRR